MIVVVCRRGFAFEYRVVVVATILPSRCVGVILHGAVLFRFPLGGFGYDYFCWVLLQLRLRACGVVDGNVNAREIFRVDRKSGFLQGIARVHISSVLAESD